MQWPGIVAFLVIIGACLAVVDPGKVSPEVAATLRVRGSKANFTALKGYDVSVHTSGGISGFQGVDVSNVFDCMQACDEPGCVAFVWTDKSDGAVFHDKGWETLVCGIYTCFACKISFYARKHEEPHRRGSTFVKEGTDLKILD